MPLTCLKLRTPDCLAVLKVAADFLPHTSKAAPSTPQPPHTSSSSMEHDSPNTYVHVVVVSVENPSEL